MKSSDALKNVRGLLGFKVRYVCLALKLINATDTDVYRRLRSVFAGPTHTSMSVVTWLKRQGINTREYSAYDFLTYRLRWIDWMIEGYEKVGD